MDPIITILFLIGTNITYSGMLGVLIAVKLKGKNLKSKKFDKLFSILNIALLIFGVIYTLGRSETLRDSAILNIIVILVITIMLGVNVCYFRKILMIEAEKPRNEGNPYSSEKDDYFD